jgi:hypothetical protein
MSDKPKRTTMTARNNGTTKEPVARCPPPSALDKHNPHLKHLAGSNYDDWNTLVANQVMQSGWYPNKMDPEQRQKMHFGFLCFMSGVEPKDELEGMLASQLLASHNAAMECYRRAMLPEQTFEGRRENLGQANKLSRTHATLLEALNRHRGKGQQKVTVEHVHVHEGGQAIVGNVEGVGYERNRRINPMLLDMHRAKRCGARTRSGKPCLSPAMANGRCRMHGGPSPGAPKGNRNALKSGRFTAEAIANRREISALLVTMRRLVADITD